MSRQLFHFTRVEYLPSILNRGLMLGRVPLAEGVITSGICFTELPDSKDQGWTKETLTGDLERPKSHFRLTVKIPDESRLLKWKFFAQKFGISSRDFAGLNASGSGDPYRWYVYLDPITPSAITEVCYTVQNQVLNADLLHRIRQNPQLLGVYALDEIWLSQEEAQKRKEAA